MCSATFEKLYAATAAMERAQVVHQMGHRPAGTEEAVATITAEAADLKRAQ